MKTYLLIFAFLFLPISAWATANGDSQVVELESCKDKEITLVIDDPISVQKTLTSPGGLSVGLRITKYQETYPSFEMYVYDLYQIHNFKPIPKVKFLLQDDKFSVRETIIDPSMKNLYNLILHKNYVEFKITPIFRTGDVCGIKEKFNISFYPFLFGRSNNSLGSAILD